MTTSVPRSSAASYQPPRLVVQGSVADLTLANAAGMVTDRAFPAGTPVDHLTFSG